jgi:hypothetical protein
VHGKPALKTMTRELRESERRNITVDRTVRENVWVQVRVRRTLRTYGYPPDKQRRTQTVLQQAEVLS